MMLTGQGPEGVWMVDLAIWRSTLVGWVGEGGTFVDRHCEGRLKSRKKPWRDE